MRPTFELALAGGVARQYVAFVPSPDGGRTAEHTFEWRDDSTALALDLGALAQAAIAGRKPDGDLHISFGRRLFEAVFGGAVGELWRARLEEAHSRREPLRLVLRIDAGSAAPLLNLPWEYLHDERDFLALSWRSPLSRLPWGLPSAPSAPLAEPLRLLVLIAAPLGLGQNEVLNTAREEDLILSVLAQARRAGRVEIEFAPNGSLEALEAALREFDPHALHFVGHGVFDSERDRGWLLMETPGGQRREVPNDEFASVLGRQGRSLRLVFLSACQSAVAPRTEGYADLGSQLLRAGIPAVVAMQFSVLNRSAMAFGSAFYKGIADGDPLDGALTEARNRLARESPNTVDFAVPVLFLADPDCLRADPAASRPARPQAPLDLTGVATVENFVGRTAELRDLRNGLDPDGGRWRAAIIYGLGGMGKTVLAARLAERMATDLDGVKSIRVTPTTSAGDILDQVAGFLLVNNARLNHPPIPGFARTVEQPLPLESKAAALIEILRMLRLLLVFDNYEDVLPGGRLVSRAAATTMDDRRQTMAASTVDHPSSAEPAPDAQAVQSGVDPDLAKLVALLIEGLPGPSRLLFTSRVDFEPIERGRLAGAIGHIALGEMQFRDAVYLMETLPPLDTLPIAVLSDTTNEDPRRDAKPREDDPRSHAKIREDEPSLSAPSRAFADQKGEAQTGEDEPPLSIPSRAFADQKGETQAGEDEPPLSVPSRTFADQKIGMRPLSMRDLYARLGGHPYTLGLFAEHARRSSPQAVLDGLAGIKRELLDFTLLDRAADALPERARTLLRCAAIYDEPAPLDGLAFLMGDERDCMPRVHDEAGALLSWGLLARPPGSADYAVHALVRDWARDAMEPGERLALLRRAAQFWLATGRESSNLDNYLSARHYLFLAGDYQQAGEIVQLAVPYLHRWGQIELVLRLLNESVRTLSGSRRAVALGNRATIYQRLGDYATARKDYEQVLAEFQALGDRRNIAAVLHQLGVLHQAQGEYEQARQRYEQSLALKQELGDRAGLASSLHQLGVLHQEQGEYEQARQRYEQSLALAQELGDRAGLAGSLHQLGVLHQAQGEYEQAWQHYQQSLAIQQELGNRAGLASSLHQLGVLRYLQGEYEQAQQRYQQSLALAQELGDRASVARSLHGLGMLHQDQGEYEQARQRYEQSLALKQELGNRAGLASTLHELGVLHQQQGEYAAARQRYEQSLALKQELGDRAGLAGSLHQLGMLFEVEESFAQAAQYVAQAFVILDQLGSPDREIAGGTLARLREKMGEEAFTAAVEAALTPDPPGAAVGAESGDAGQAMTERTARAGVKGALSALRRLWRRK